MVDIREGMQGDSGQHNVGESSTARKARHEAGQMAEELRQRGKGYMDEQKSAAVRSLDRVASTMESAAHDLEQDQPLFSKIFQEGAEGLNRFSRTLKERDSETLLQQAQDFARRQPALMIGGTVAAGFLLTRILRSSSSSGEFTQEERRSEPRTWESSEEAEGEFYAGTSTQTPPAGSRSLQRGSDTFVEPEPSLTSEPSLTEEESHARD